MAYYTRRTSFKIVGVSDEDTTPGFLADKIVAGSNVTLDVLNPGGDEKLQINATGGSGAGTPEVPTGAVDGVNTVFVFTKVPAFIVVDEGRSMIENNGWTASGTTVTLDIAPNFSIFGIV